MVNVSPPPLSLEYVIDFVSSPKLGAELKFRTVSAPPITLCNFPSSPTYISATKLLFTIEKT